MTDRPRPRHPALAALLSFLLPGLGQAYAGDRLMATVLAAPVLLLVVMGVLVAAVFADRLRNDVLSSPFLLGLLVLDAALLGWRLFAIAHAGLGRPLPAGRAAVDAAGTGSIGTAAVRPVMTQPVNVAIVAVLMFATIGMHAYAGVLVAGLNSTLTQIFTPGGAANGRAAGPLNKPDYRWNGTERINFLLLGIDSGPGRSEALTDTILVVSVDPVKRSAVLVSIPRDTGFMPLPDRRIYSDGRYPQKINQLSSDSGAKPSLWCSDLPKPGDCGIRTLERSVGLYLGINIQYYARVDLEGFASLIDSLGGVDLCLPGKLVDPGYSGPTWYPRVGIELAAGCQQYDGKHALAFARIRKGVMQLPGGKTEQQTDFTRADRQQQVLLALRKKLADANLVFALPGLLNAIGNTVTTDFPRSLAGDLASLLPLITGPEIQRVVLAWPQYVDLPTNPTVNYLLIPKREAIRTQMRKLFGAAGPLQGWYVGSQAALPPAVSPTVAPSGR